MPSSFTSELEVRFPDVRDGGTAPDQDHEWCEVLVDDTPRRIRFHDYGEIFAVPGLYETIFHDHLQCASPAAVVGLLERELRHDGVDPATLRGVDVGAGNGMVGEELAKLGVGSLVGVDLLEEAAEAAERDRPGLYDDYVVCDLTALDEADRQRLEAGRPNLLTTVAALGFGDIPSEAFTTAYDAVADGAWIAFNIKAEFLEAADQSGFGELITSMLDDGTLDERARLRYDHRLSMTKQAIEYIAIVGVKHGDAVPAGS